MRNIGKRIAAAREKAGLNQSELARALKVTPQSVQAWESSKNIPRPKKLEAIAAVLGETMGYLMGETDSEKPGISLDIYHGSEHIEGHTEEAEAVFGKIPVIGKILTDAISAGTLRSKDLSLLASLASALIEQNRSSGLSAPSLPDHLEGLADAAFSSSAKGESSEDILKMIGHGLNKSGEKESTRADDKRKKRVS